MCEKVLKDNKHVSGIKYELPNKVRLLSFALYFFFVPPFLSSPFLMLTLLSLQHYIPPDLSYIGLKNTDPKDAEVFTPVDAPSGCASLLFLLSPPPSQY